jgi:hypothetical protein
MLAMLAAAAPAANAFGITNFSAQPASKAAGANSDLTVSFNVSDSPAGLKDLTVHLPPGLIGNPLATPTCTETKLKADNCPAASDVGDAVNNVIVKPLGLLPIPLTVNGQVYNVEPRNGEPARFGIVLDPSPVPGLGAALPKIVLQQTARLRQGDFGLDTSLKDIPRSAKVAGVSTPLEVTGVSLTLEGKIDGKGFLRNPTSCGVQPISIDADAYNNATATAQDQFTTTNCNALPFSPRFSAKIKQTSSNLLDPVQLSTTISQTIAEAGLKKAVVTLPKEVIGNGPALAVQCSIPDFDAGNCSGDTKVGDAVAASPLQAKPLAGNVYLVNPAIPGPFPDLGVDLRGGLALKVKGSLSAIPVAGGGLQIVVTFDGLPDIPLSEFTLTFADGPDGLNLVSRNPCQPPPLSFDADFTGQAGQLLNVSSPADATCPGSSGKRPKAKVELAKLKSGKPKLGISLKAGAAELRNAKVVLPKGLKVGAKRKLKRGTEIAGGAVNGKGRKLTVRAKGGAVDRIKLQLSKGAVKARHGLGERHLGKFKLRIRDADGKLTKLAVKAK